MYTRLCVYICIYMTVYLLDDVSLVVDLSAQRVQHERPVGGLLVGLQLQQRRRRRRRRHNRAALVARHAVQHGRHLEEQEEEDEEDEGAYLQIPYRSV